MSFFRKHIIRIVTILFIQLGFLICLSPSQLQNETNRHFTHWLNGFIKSKSGNQFKQQFKELGESNHAISQLMTRASELISKHADRFRLPFKKQKPSEKEVYNVLLVEWNLYHQSTATSSMVLLEHTKSQNLFNPDNHPFVPALSSALIKREQPSFSRHFLHTLNTKFQTPTASPLSSGIAIGAP